MSRTEAVVTALIVMIATCLSLGSAPEDRRTRLVGYGCTEGPVVQYHDEEDLFPACRFIEPNR